MGILRLLLAISVVLAHTQPIFGIEIVGGQVAVQAFYIISGFYMSLILNEKYIGKNNSYRLFLSNRFLRLYPIYWTVLVITILISIAIGLLTKTNWVALSYYQKFGGQLNLTTLFFLVVSNLLLIGQDLAMYLGINLQSGSLFFTSNFWATSPFVYKFMIIPQAWTIGVEICFYLIAPFIVTKKIHTVFGLILLSLAIRVLLIQNDLGKDPWNYRFFPNELLFFLLGNISYRIYKIVDKKQLDKIFQNSIWIGIVILTLFYYAIDYDNKIIVYFILFFLAIPFVFQLTRNSKLDYQIGELSYPIYICHMLFVMFIHKLTFITNIMGTGATTVILSILFSLLLNRVVAKPIEKYRQKRLVKQ